MTVASAVSEVTVPIRVIASEATQSIDATKQVWIASLRSQ